MVNDILRPHFVMDSKNSGDVDGSCVLQVPFESLAAAPISLVQAEAPACRLRFVDCRSFVDRESLRILQFKELPAQKYSAISYIWKGRKPKTPIKPPLGWIIIDGADGADPICIDVLRLACLTSLRLGCDLMWIDGFCIIQGNETDRAWQIQHMYDIYKSCTECIIIPGGLSRLVPLTEETNWIHRAWTLQEALAPPSAHCLFSWSGGVCNFQSNFYVSIQEIESMAAIAEMKGLLEMSLKPRFSIQKLGPNSDIISEEDSDFEIVIFGNRGEQFSQIGALIGALDLRGQEGMANAIWRSSFMRTAKFPRDMVFSIMGLLGITLDASKYKEPDRIPATIDLMRAILDKGGRAEWLGIATRIENNPELSTIPVFPKYGPSGRAVVPTKSGEADACTLMDGWWMIQNTPKGTIDTAGNLKFTAPAVSVKRTGSNALNLVFDSVMDGEWEVLAGRSGSQFAVQIGTKENYTSGIFGTMIDPNKYALMLIERNGLGKFSTVGYAFVDEDLMNSAGWSEEHFEVGGPRISTAST